MAPRNTVAVRLSVEDAEQAKKIFRSFGEEGKGALQKIERSTGKTNRGLLAVNAVSGELKGSFQATAANAGALGAGLSTMGPAGLAAAAALAAVVLSIGKLNREGRESINRIAALKDESEQAGIAAVAYQELNFVARNFSVTTEALTDGLKELALRGDEFVETGAGPAADAFKRLGFTQSDLQGRLKDTDKLFVEVIRRMEDLDTAAQIRIADEIFGGQGGEQFVRILEGGSDAIEALRQEARDLGIVVDDAMIQKADEARDRLEILSQVTSVNLNTALLHLSPIIVGVAEAFAEVAKFVGEVVDGFSELENKTSGGLSTELGVINDELDALYNRRERELASGNVHAGLEVKEIDRQIAEAEGRLRDVQIEIEKRQLSTTASLPSRFSGGTGVNVKGAERAQTVSDGLNQQLLKLQVGNKEFEKLSALNRAGVTADSAEGEAIVRQIEQIQKLRALREQEKQDLQEKEKFERDVASAIEAGTEAERQRAQTYREYVEDLELGIRTTQLEIEGKHEQADLLRAEEDLRRRLGKELLPAQREELETLIRTQSEQNKILEMQGQQLQKTGDVLTGAIQAGQDGSDALARYFINNIDQIIDAFFELYKVMGGSGDLGGGSGLGGLFSAGFSALFGGGGGGGGYGAGAAAANISYDYIPAFHTGGRMIVGGAPGVDKNLVNFFASRGEEITVRTPEQQRAARTAKPQNVFYITMGGGVSQEEFMQLKDVVRSVDGSIEGRALAANINAEARGMKLGSS